MTATGVVVYSLIVALYFTVFGLLMWGLHLVMSREVHNKLAPAFDQALRESENGVAADAMPNRSLAQANSLNIRPLAMAERTRFTGDWQSLQPRFEHDPEDAVQQADRLVSDVMQMRGYPTGEIAPSDIENSDELPDVVNHYLAAHRLAQRAADGHATTEEERRALAQYRELFDELLSDASPDKSAAHRVA